jgi:cold shock CspA family protein
MFFMILVAGFIMWAKSSTDIFVFFTIVICAYFVRLEEGDIEEEEEEEADDGLPETVS